MFSALRRTRRETVTSLCTNAVPPKKRPAAAGRFFIFRIAPEGATTTYKPLPQPPLEKNLDNCSNPSAHGVTGAADSADGLTSAATGGGQSGLYAVVALPWTR